MINTKVIIKKLAKYVIAVLITMYAWGLAGTAVSAKDDLAVVGGLAIYFAIVAGWIVLIARETNGATKKVADTPDNKVE